MKKIIGVIGSSANLTTKNMYEFTQNLTKELAAKGYSIVCGGLGGVMEATALGVKKASNPNALSICIIPQDDKKFANLYCDIVIPTGIGECRNKTVVNTADILIAIGGGAGTLSEIAFAWKQNKKVICITKFNGWAKTLAGQNIDTTAEGLLIPSSSIEQTITLIEQLLGK